jgi:hypothetical protein
MARQAATLAALDEQTTYAGRVLSLADGEWREIIVGIVAGLRGRRSIQVRHGPRPDGLCIMCRWPNGELMPWPWPDWRDASAGLEVPD